MLCHWQNILKDREQILRKWMDGVVRRDAVYLNPRQLTYGDIDLLVWQWYLQQLFSTDLKFLGPCNRTTIFSQVREELRRGAAHHRETHPGHGAAVREGAGLPAVHGEHGLAQRLAAPTQRQAQPQPQPPGRRDPQRPQHGLTSPRVCQRRPLCPERRGHGLTGFRSEQRSSSRGGQ